MTATAAPAAQAEIAKSLKMKEYSAVHLSADRSNIFLEVTSRPPSTGGMYTVEDSYNSILNPYLEELVHLRQKFRKTVIYLPLQWCAYAHSKACYMLGLDLHQPDSLTHDGQLDSLVAQYHAPQGTKMKKLIALSMKNTNSVLRLLFATEAYGMGTDAPDMERIIHIGPPATIETLVQEMGRAGRAGQQSTATVLFNATDLAQNRKHMSTSVRDYCKLITCRRRFLCNYFGDHFGSEVPAHLCCDNCLNNSTTNTEDPADTCLVELQELNLDQGRASSSEQRQEAASLLEQYFFFENSALLEHPVPQLTTGLTPQFANDLSKDLLRYSELEILTAEYHYIEDHFLQNICVILQSVL